MRKVLLAAGAAAVALSGCVSLDQYDEQSQMVQLDNSTFRLSLYQPWMKQEVSVREAARQDAQKFCDDRGQGMQPLSATSDPAGGDKTGASVEYTFRCVGYVAAPKDANVFRRIGFYETEESRQEAYKEMEEYEKTAK